MSEINLNNSEEFIKEFKVFNDGNAAVVENVKMRIEKKASTDTDDKKPMYKLIATDTNGAEINEGFYYQEVDSKAFNNFQAQRLINLARGVLGKDVKFPVWNTPKEVLDGVMKLVAPVINQKFWRVATCYGTTKRKESYLGFKNFGSFIQPMTEDNTLAFDKSDNLVREPIKTATPASELIKDMTTKAGNPDNLDWMNT
jgi:hypothetical protein